MEIKDNSLYESVVKELESLNHFLWLTPFLARRKAILETLKSHIEAGYS